MRVDTLRLSRFRAHEDSRFSFGPGLNLLHGANGVGKTNVLEAIHYACLGKSFIATSDQYVLRRGADHLEVEARVSLDARGDTSVRFVYVPREGKRVFVNGAPLDRLVDVVGRFPVVAISPDDHRLTDGGPEERRRLLDTVLCQERPRYLEALMRFRRVVRQRNEVLAAARPGRATDEALGPWDVELTRYGARITWYRMQFVERFGTYLDEAFRRIGEVVERPRIAYRAFTDVDGAEGEDDLADRFTVELSRRAGAERDRGLTLVGPHRDELVFRLDDLEVRRYASHGQHRTFVLALRLAQYYHLRDTVGETPLLLMDDVFDNLDPARIRIFVDLLTADDAGQTIVTAAREDLFGTAVTFDGNRHRSLHIGAGGEASDLELAAGAGGSASAGDAEDPVSADDREPLPADGAEAVAATTD